MPGTLWSKRQPLELSCVRSRNWAFYLPLKVGCLGKGATLGEGAVASMSSSAAGLQLLLKGIWAVLLHGWHRPVTDLKRLKEY